LCLFELSQSQLATPPKLLQHHSDLKGWLLDWIGKASSDDVALMITMLYNLWQARNDARESQKLADPKSVATRTVAGIEEWKSAQTVAPSVSVNLNEHWLKPDWDWVKINTDGAYRASEAYGGGGVVIRNHHGSYVGGASHFFPHLLDAEGAELQACRLGLQLARTMPVSKVILETDSTEVAAKLSRDERDRSVHGPLVEEIKSLLRGFGDSSVRAVRRTANKAAHLLAKEGCVNKLCNVWYDSVPMCIRNQIVLDSDLS
jgi:ribonuclease HI